ncbi:hypothetical protein N9L68_06125, partial [bacterium]|nr:hypothetical protein [bacterium]
RARWRPTPSGAEGSSSGYQTVRSYPVRMPPFLRVDYEDRTRSLPWTWKMSREAGIYPLAVSILELVVIRFVNSITGDPSGKPSVVRLQAWNTRPKAELMTLHTLPEPQGCRFEYFFERDNKTLVRTGRTMNDGLRPVRVRPILAPDWETAAAEGAGTGGHICGMDGALLGSSCGRRDLGLAPRDGTRGKQAHGRSPTEMGPAKEPLSGWHEDSAVNRAEMWEPVIQVVVRRKTALVGMDFSELQGDHHLRGQPCRRHRQAGQEAGPHAFGAKPFTCGCCAGTCEICGGIDEKSGTQRWLP